MGLLIRTALLIGIGVMLIPADPAELEADGLATKADAFATLGFAKAAYDDAAAFCTRNPDACETGSAIAASFGAKARTGAKWVYGTLSPSAAIPAASAAPQPAPPHPVVATAHPDGRRTGATQPMPDPIATGSVALPHLPVPRPKPAHS